MKKLVICCDGTWDTAHQRQLGVPTPSNVVRLFNAVCDSDATNVLQQKYYHSGVGTSGGWWEKVAGGGLGIGLDKNIMSAYRWLGEYYEPGDAIYVFGFSRGAFTARSLVGMIDASGLLDLRGLAEEEMWHRVERAYNQGYRHPDKSHAWAGDWAFLRTDDGRIPICFLGVWDTVGALGIPDDMAILNLFDDPHRYEFLDTQLSTNVENARQAVALDERRASFTPTLWTGVEGRSNVKQIWFPGVHEDVGGGYLQTGLSDGALQWMMDQAEGCGLSFNVGMASQLQSDPQGVLHDSDTGLFAYLRTRPRSTPPVNANDQVHASALTRQHTPPISQAPYWPTVQLSPGGEMTVSVFARQHWNATGIYLEANARYEFQAHGQWMDGNLKSGPEGTKLTQSFLATIKDGVASLAGELEKLYKKFTHNEQVDVLGSRRVEGMPWSALVGVVANGGNPGKDGTPQPHETFLIGQKAELPQKQGQLIAKPGYLYCFMNDAWHFYHNNRGSVTLTVRRLK